MARTGAVLGVDAGSVSVSFVEIAGSGRVRREGSAPHHGRVRETLEALLGTGAPDLPVAATSSTPDCVPRARTVDGQVAAITAVRKLHPDARSLIVVGGEEFRLVRFDATGAYAGSRSSTSCAAGTGSFLDQQARNLGLADGAALARTARKATGTPPKIASRCAVFAKTDLIHAQQEGHRLPEICAGLCLGLANIVADTLFSDGPPDDPTVLAGGVARNDAVRVHLERRAGQAIRVDPSAHLYGALGAALFLLERGPEPRANAPATAPAAPELREPLELRLSTWPDFRGERRYEHQPPGGRGTGPVEVDVYRRPAGPGPIGAWLGLDVGSTSTKAALLGTGGEVLAGFYTRTAGRPVPAAQAVLGAIQGFARDGGTDLRILGFATTGSGRKLLGAVFGADLVVDEITAHARAATEEDPETDTILEIGGQDAKFTTLRGGRVTSAAMNSVCAAGTGSFVEEQARRLDVPIETCAERVAGARSPLASSRCTVFMQRDVNHLLARGHDVPEILACVLHAVCENYIERVAREAAIGERIAFQGATGKNRALVAAFERRLGRPIRVSRYCHLTGALGAALLLRETPPETSAFRGLALASEEIPLEPSECGICRNHCRIVTAAVRGEKAAWGHLCGREPDSDRYVSRNTSGFDLLATRRRILRVRPEPLPEDAPVAGIPAALHLFEDLEVWRRFFARLGVRVVTSEGLEDPVGRGKRIARAEFCAPMAAWHAHVDSLLDRADFVFAPVCLEAREREGGASRQHCYYTQYASALTDPRQDPRIVRPLLLPGFADVSAKLALHGALKPVLGAGLSLLSVANAYAEALRDREERRERLREETARQLAGHDDVAVVLLGRPYTVLSPRMNKGIPDFLGALGVKTFFEDMIGVREEEAEAIRGLLAQVHWKWAGRILAAASAVARRPGLYPVLVTSFKCAPDSMTIEFFRRILDGAGKPWLVLELDEHGSSVGYETRIEAAVRAFRNHLRRPAPAPAGALPVVPALARSVTGRTLFIPAWDRLSCALLAASLRREGVDARLLPETASTIRRGLRRNTGQCVPLGAIAESFVSEVRRLELDPARTALWVLDSRISCNIGMYPGFLKALFEAEGGGFERAAVYAGEVSLIDISERGVLDTWFAYMFGGLLRRMACRIRPYEFRPGAADDAVARGLAIFTESFLGRGSREEAVEQVVGLFAAIPTSPRDRPKVAIFGDLYVRDNEVMSQDLVRFIERHGGEVITTPYTEYVKTIAEPLFRRWLREGRILPLVVNKSLLTAARVMERRYAEVFARVLGPWHRTRPHPDPERLLALFSVTARHAGESLENLLEVFHILRSDPDVSLFVQANPAFCCPSLVTEAQAARIREVTGVPVVTVTYDGTAAPRNDAIVPHLEFAVRGGAPAPATA